MVTQLIECLNRLSRLHTDLQHLVVLTFPRTQNNFQLYLRLRDDVELGVFSSKLKNHAVYSKSIISHLDVPSITGYYMNGQIKYQKWLNKDEEKHRESESGGPAYIEYYENNGNGHDAQIEMMSWYKDGQLQKKLKTLVNGKG